MSSIALSRIIGGRSKGEGSTSTITRVFLVLIAVLVVTLIMEVVFHLIIAPRLVVRHVDIIADSTVGLDEESLLTIAELSDAPYYFDVDPQAIEAKLETYPVIKDTLRIQVVGRQPLAIALVEKNGNAVPVAFDEDGVVFQIGSSVERLDLPVVSGLTFADVRLGQRIARPLTDFLKDLEHLRRDAPALFNLISEVKFVKKNRSGFEVVLFPRDYPVRILIGSDISVETMKRIVLVLDVFSRQGVDDRIAEIDFRTDDVVMRMKGE